MGLVTLVTAPKFCFRDPDCQVSLSPSFPQTLWVKFIFPGSHSIKALLIGLYLIAWTIKVLLGVIFMNKYILWKVIEGCESIKLTIICNFFYLIFIITLQLPVVHNTGISSIKCSNTNSATSVTFLSSLSSVLIHHHSLPLYLFHIACHSTKATKMIES